MADCIYCGRPVGFMKKRHPQCRERHEKAVAAIPQLFAKFLYSAIEPSRFQDKLRQIAEVSFINQEKLHQLSVQGFSELVSTALDDHLLTVDEERRIELLRRQFSFNDDEILDPLRSLIKIGTLRDLDEGKLPNRLKFENGLPINLQKDDSVVWVFGGVGLSQIKTKTSYVGGSHGVSVRIARGVYYRVGAHKGQRVQTEHLVPQDSGALIISGKHLYFSGETKSFRIPYSKIVAIKLYSDGLQVTRESVNPKPHYFLFGEAAFAANLISRIASL